MRIAALLALVTVSVCTTNAFAQTESASSAPPATSPPPTNGASVSSASPSPAPSAEPNAVLIDAFPAGVDSAAATFVTGVLRDTLTRLGYALVPTPQFYDAARAAALPFPPTPEAIVALLATLNSAQPVSIPNGHQWRTVTFGLHVPMAVTCELHGGGGYYQAILRVRFGQEGAERIRQVLATQWTLGDMLRTTLPAMLAAAAPYAGWGPNYPPGGSLLGYTPPPRPPPTRLHPNPVDISLGLEFAFGPGGDTFFNFLAYGRLAYFPFDRFGITASVSYANLRAHNGRVSNALFMVGVETAVDLFPRAHVYLPLRVEIGYLPFNGPVLRATAAVAIGLTKDVRLELDLLSVSAWFLTATSVTAATLNLGAQLTFGVGAKPPPPPPHHHHHHHHPSSSPPPSDEPESSASPDSNDEQATSPAP